MSVLSEREREKIYSDWQGQFLTNGANITLVTLVEQATIDAVIEIIEKRAEELKNTKNTTEIEKNQLTAILRNFQVLIEAIKGE